MSRAPALEAELKLSDPRQALFDAACSQVLAQFPRTIVHSGRTWWVNVMPGGPSGMAVVSLFDAPGNTCPSHAFVVQLGHSFGHGT